MNIEKQEALLIGSIGIVFGILFCVLAFWILSFETATDTNTYGFMGINLTGNALAALAGWIGFVIIFFSVRKMIRTLSQNKIK